MDSRAQGANRVMGSNAYATGDDIGFATTTPSLHLAAHEAAHVVQQRSGMVQLSSQVGAPGDRFEREADAAADAVVQGRSAAPILGRYLETQRGGSAVQHQLVQHDISEARRATARAKVTNYERTLTDYSLSFARFNSRNWTRFIHACGGNYFIVWHSGQFINILSAVASTAAGLLAPVAAGAIIGTAITPGIGTVIGAIVGFLASAIIGAFLTALGNDAAMRAVNDTLRAAGTQTQEKIDEFDANHDATVVRIRDYASTATSAIDGATEEAQLTSWESSVDEMASRYASPVSATNYTLYNEMMADWVLQHAGDEEDQNAETNYAAYDQNREEQFGVGANENLVRKDLFIHQCKYEFGRMGLDIGVMSGMESRFNAIRASSRASVIASTFHGTQFQWTRTSNPEAAIQKIEQDYDGGDMAEGSKTDMRNNNFLLKCTLDLTDSDGACYVDEYEWWGQWYSGDGNRNPATWAEAPD